MGFLGSTTALFKQAVWSVVSMVIVFCLVPVFLLITVPIYIYRGVVSVLGRKILPKSATKVGKLLNIRSAMFGPELTDNQENITSNLVISFIFQGEYTTDLAKEWFQKLLVMKEANGQLQYPELSQYLIPWMGFTWWKKDKGFTLNNHIKYIWLNEGQKVMDTDEMDKDIPVSAEQLGEIEKQLLARKFKENTSPWELRVVKNFRPKNAREEEKYSAGLFKVHHGLADGYSISKLFLVNVLGIPPEQLPKPEFPAKGWLSTFIQNLWVFICAPSDIITQVMMKPDSNSWHLPPDRHCGNHKYYTASSDRIPLTYLKSIKNHHKVSLKALLFAAWTGAIRTAMLKRKDKIPETITMMSPFPMPGHPDRLRNYWSGLLLQFPTGIESPRERLRHMENYLQSLKYSTAPLTAFAIQPFLGGLLHGMIKAIAKVPFPTGLASDFPGPFQTIVVDGLVVQDIYFSGGHPPGSCMGIMLYGTSYAGGWKLKVQLDGGLASSNQEAQEIVDNFVSEIVLLNNMSHV